MQMKHVNLNTVSENVRQVILSFSANGAVFELDGRPVASLIPQQSDTDEQTEWNTARNDRRCQLIDKSIASTITPEESVELDRLQTQMGRWLDQVAPLPMEHARKLHGELVELANRKSLPE